MARGIRTEEQVLVAAANAGDRDAIGSLYAMHESWVTRLAMRYTGNREDAEDVKHDTFIYLLSKFPGFELRSSLRSFLFPAVRHKSISVIRRRRKTADIERVEPSTPAPRVTAGDFERMVARLPDHERHVVERRFREGMALAEIAAALDIPLGTVKSRLHKAITRLRAWMDEPGPDHRQLPLPRERAA
jgi:RNA polymerase sigma-70 factor (ECF subfamily)